MTGSFGRGLGAIGSDGIKGGGVGKDGAGSAPGILIGSVGGVRLDGSEGG